MEEPKLQEQQGENKVKKKFEQSLKRVQALMQSPDWYRPNKIGKDDLPGLLEQLTSDRKTELFEKFKKLCNILVDKKLAYDKAVKEKEKEFNAAVEAKMKEFQVDMDAIFALVDQIDNITKDYFGALTSIQEGTPPAIVGNPQPGEDAVG